MQQVRVATTATAIFHLHDSFVALLAGHQLGNHGTVLLVNGGLVGVWPANRTALVVAVVLVLALNLGQLKVMVPPILIGPNLPLHVVVGKHRVVQSNTTLGCMALPLVFVIVYAIDVDDPFVVLSRVTLNLNEP